MCLRIFPLFFSFLLTISAGLAQESPVTGEASPVVEQALPSSAPAARLSARHAVILGLVEGITEFLPISSTGHLIIANHVLGLESEEPLYHPDGTPLWHKDPSEEHPAGVPLTIKEASDTYAVVIQVGAIAAVVFIYASQLLGILRGLLGKNAAGVRLLRNIILAFLPAATVGLLTHEWIDEHLFSIETVIVALIVGAAIMVGAERWRGQKRKVDTRLEPADLTAKQALCVGLMQCFALWPGMSRSMMTMVGGYFVGLSPAKAAEFSFLVGLPTLGGAAFLKSMSSGKAMISVFGWSPVILGGLVAAVSAAVAVRFLVRYLARHGLGFFAAYRVVLALLLVGWFFA